MEEHKDTDSEVKTETKDEGFCENRGHSSSPSSTSSSASSFSTSCSSTKKEPTSTSGAESVSYMSSTTIFALHHSVTVVGGSGGDTMLTLTPSNIETRDPNAKYHHQNHYSDVYSMEPLFNEIPYYPSQSCSSAYYNSFHNNYPQNNYQNSYFDNNNNKNPNEYGKCCERMDQRHGHEQKCCRCVIDISTPATLERDFYAWLNGTDDKETTSHIGSPCLFMPTASSSSYSYSNYTSSRYCYPLNSSAFTKSDYDIATLSSNMFSNACTTMYDPGGECENILSPSTTTTSNGTFDALSNSSSSISPLSSTNNNFVRGRFNSFSTISPYTTATTKTNVTNSTKTINDGANNSSSNSAAKQHVRREYNKKYTTEKGLHRGTNLYGRPYCPGRPLSMEERAQIINLFHGGMKVNAISKRLCISHGCVSKIITSFRFRETGLLIPSSHSECRRRKRLLAAAQQQQHYHQQQLLLQQQQAQHQQLLQQQKHFLVQQQQQSKKIKTEY